MLSKLLREYKVSKETRDSMVKKQTKEWWIKHVCEVHNNKCRCENIIRLVVEEMVDEVIKTHQVGGIVDEYVDDILEDSDSDSFEESIIGEEVQKEVVEEVVNETHDSWLGIPFRSFHRVGILMANRFRRATSPPNTVVIVDRNCEDREEYFPSSK
jgi:hypothetical protein